MESIKVTPMIVTKTLQKGLLVIAFAMASFSYADPHYVQALDPYYLFGGDRDLVFSQYINKFKRNVSVEVSKFERSDGEVIYMYLYVIKNKSASNFTVDISCPASVKGVPIINEISSDPIQKNPPAITNGFDQISWKLKMGVEVQVMWFYAWRPPVERSYALEIGQDSAETIKDERFSLQMTSHVAIKNLIQGPGCTKEVLK